MRKYSKKFKIWHDNRCRRISHVCHKKIKYPNHFSHKQFYISAPKNLSIINNRDEAYEFFEEILKIFEDKNIKGNHSYDNLHIDLSAVEQISIETIMYLVAITNNIKYRFARKVVISGNFPKDKKVKDTVLNSGFLNYVRSGICKKDYIDKPNIQIIKGNKVNPKDVGQVIDFIQNNSRCDTNTLRCLYTMIIEIMTNTVEHAYNNTKDVLLNNWYIYVDITDTINITILDTGEGIPSTLLRKFTDNLFIFSDKYESRLIVSALKGVFRSETNKKYRGKGLPQILDIFNNSNIKNISIMAGRGGVILDKNSDNKLLPNSLYNFVGTVYYINI